jgi:transcriptional regulator with GAF, ATPase, and Fis domain
LVTTWWRAPFPVSYPVYFELADGGTVFLEEIGELPPETQVKLLRVLQEQEFEPVGSNHTRRVDVRVIAATNQDLGQVVAEGRFRSDLFFRMNVLPIRVPALRERRDDIPLLLHFFAARFARQIGKRIDGVSRQTMERLIAYDWPGNGRELQNIVERAMVLAKGPVLELGPDFLSLLQTASARFPGPLRRCRRPSRRSRRARHRQRPMIQRPPGHRDPPASRRSASSTFCPSESVAMG